MLADSSVLWSRNTGHELLVTGHPLGDMIGRGR